MSVVREWPLLDKLSLGKPPNPTWEAAENIIGKLEELDETEREIVRTRWLTEVKQYDRLWQRQRLGYYSLRVPMVVVAATVPLLASLNVPKLTTALAGLAVAILTGLDSLFRLGTRWQQGRLAETRISFEGWRFLELSGEDYRFKKRREAYEIFLTRLEKLNEELSTARLDLFSDGDRGHRHP